MGLKSIHVCALNSFVCLSLGSMSVTQAMEWLIEHVDDPSVDAPIPGQDSSGAAGATAAATPSTSASGATLLRSLSSQSSTEESSRQDELTEIFKRIRRKREFRPDSRVSALVSTSAFQRIPQRGVRGILPLRQKRSDDAVCKCFS